jgi:hypothetical protein
MALFAFAPAPSAHASAANHREGISASQKDDAVIANGDLTQKSNG